MSSGPRLPLEVTPGPGTRRGLWVEIAGTLALITLLSILANAALFSVLAFELELQRRTDLARSVARTLRSEMEATPDTRRWKEIAKAFRAGGLEISDLWMVRSDLDTVFVIEGGPPVGLDPGLQSALQSRTEHVEVVGEAFEGRRAVVVTAPVSAGRDVLALRVGLPLEGEGPVAPGIGLVVGFSFFSSSIVALSGYALLRRRLLSPIARIQEATQAIAGGEFGTHVRVNAASELTQLAAALNILSFSLESYRERTREQVESLEEANAELKEVQDQLIRSARLASVGGMAAGIAHEIGNPLAAVLGYVELLNSDLQDPVMERDLLERTRKEIDRIHRIIRDLLDYARPGTGERVELSPVVLLREAVDTVAPLPALKEVKVLVLADPELPSVVGEADKLHQVLVNLLLNAGGAIDGEGTIQARAEERDGEVVFSVLDSGPGFDEAVLPTVFEPFVTTKDVGQGTGLGLSICLSIVEAESGWIRAENAGGGGGLVTFGLPIP